jgi:hypothetical protein
MILTEKQSAAAQKLARCVWHDSATYIDYQYWVNLGRNPEIHELYSAAIILNKTIHFQEDVTKYKERKSVTK